MIYDFRLKPYQLWAFCLVSTCNQETLALWLSFTLISNFDRKNKPSKEASPKTKPHRNCFTGWEPTAPHCTEHTAVMLHQQQGSPHPG